MGMIQFPTDKFYGREFELSQFWGAYTRLTASESTHTTEMVLVAGFAGTGKTRLVEAFQEDLVNRAQNGAATPCYFLSGKADELTSTEPCAPLVAAFSKWCELILESSSHEEVEELRKNIADSVGDEGKVLTDLIPSLEQLIGKQPELVGQSGHGVSSVSALNRLKYIFTRFLMAITTEERPLVLFVDDLQWVDPATLSLLDYVITSQTLKNFMLIGAYRDNEVENEHSLTKCLNSIRGRGKTFMVLGLGNLALNDVIRLVADTLHLEPEQVEFLSKAIFRKTQGNIFFVRNTLHMLEDKQILKYSLSDMRWSWDAQRITIELDISENAVSVVVGRLQSLPATVQTVMTIAAFLPSTFHFETLRDLLVARSFSVTDTEGLVELLHIAVGEGLIEKLNGSPKYKFAHDKIQQAAMMLVEGEEKSLLSIEVAKDLMELSSQPGRTELMFIAVDHLNAVPVGLVDANMDIKHLAEINYDVGRRATKVSAFAVASTYFHKGVDLMAMDENRWDSHYRLCWDLYNSAAEVEFCIGSFEKAERLTAEVLDHAASFDDKLRAYQALSEGLGQRERHAEALESDMKVMKILGLAPRYTNIVTALVHLFAMKRTLSKWTDEQILGLPIVTDRKIVVAMETLSNMVVRSFYCNNKFEALFYVMQQLRLTLRHGLMAESALAFAYYSSMLCTALRDEAFGHRTASLAVSIAKLTKAKARDADIIFLLGQFLHSWNRPLPKVMGMLDRGYKAAMAVGDIEVASLCNCQCSLNAFLAGLPIEGILNDCQTLCGLLQQFSVETVSSMLTPFVNTLQALTGKTLDPISRWKEEGIVAPEDSSPRSQSKTFKYLFTYLFALQLAWYFGDTTLAYRLLLEFDKYKNADPSFFCVSLGLFFSSLICTSLFRETGKGKFRRRAQRSISTMKALTHRKGANLLPKCLIAEADYAATLNGKGHKTDIRKLFDKAIEASSKHGFMQDAAVANELAGEYFIREDDDALAKLYLTAAYRAYAEWGAHAKVKQLLDCRGSFVESDTRVSFRVPVRRQSRKIMTTEAVDMHKTVDLSRETSETQVLESSANLFYPLSFSQSSREFLPPMQIPECELSASLETPSREFTSNPRNQML